MSFILTALSVRPPGPTIGPVVPPAAPAGFHNFTGTNLPSWTSALAKVKNGTANGRVLILGNSTTFGFGAGGVGYGAGQYINSYPGQVQALINPSVNASISNRLGDGFADNLADLATFDSRCSFGTGIVQTAFACYGGFLLKMTAAGGSNSTINFHPTNHCDTFEIYTAGFPGNGTLSYAFNGGGSAGTISTNVAESYQKTVVTTSLADNILNLVWSSGSDLFLAGIIAYNSNVKEIQLLNGGVNGTTAEGYNDTGFNWGPIKAFPVMAPNLTIIDLTINDILQGTAVGTYETNLTAIVTAAAAQGDVILVSGNALDPGSVSIPSQQAIVTAMLAVAGTTTPAIDIYTILGPWVTLNANGDMFNGAHPNTAGYGLIANNIELPIITPNIVSQ